MARPAFEVEGADQLRRTMRKAGVDMTELKSTHRSVAETVTQAAKPAAPRGRTGRLAQSIRPGATQKAAIIRAGKKAVPYAGPIHWGWPKRGIKAQPWLAETAETTEPAWSDEYRAAIEKIIEKIKGK